jgi:hypothetical protein
MNKKTNQEEFIFGPFSSLNENLQKESLDVMSLVIQLCQSCHPPIPIHAGLKRAFIRCSNNNQLMSLIFLFKRFESVNANHVTID